MYKTMIIILLVAPPKSLSKQFTGTKNIRTQIMIAKIDYRFSQKKKKIPLTSPCILSIVPPTRGILENFIFVRIAGKIKRVCLSWRGLQVWRKTETGRKIENLTCSLPPSPPHHPTYSDPSRAGDSMVAGDWWWDLGGIERVKVIDHQRRFTRVWRGGVGEKKGRYSP